MIGRYSCLYKIYWLISVCLTLILFAGPVLVYAQNSDRIRPYTQNKFYWQYKGQPVLLLGASKDDNLFQVSNLKAHLDALKSVGVNYVRNTMSDRHDKHGIEVYPFLKLSGGKYDLNQWNSEYWNRFQNLLRWTKERNIIVQIELWDRFDFYGIHWEQSPYNPGNNNIYNSSGSGLAYTYPKHPGSNTNPFFKTVPEIQNNTTVLNYQKKFIDKMLSYSLQYNHVLYCMDNETNGDSRWGKYWSNYLKGKASQAGKSIETTEMWDSWDIKSSQHRNTINHPETYSFCDLSQNNHNINQTHWDNIQWAQQYLSGRPWPINNIKIYGADGANYGSTSDAIERFWRNVIGGIAGSRFHRTSAGIGFSSTAQASIRAARKLESLIKLWEVSPQNSLLTNRGSDEAYLAAKQGDKYALYFTSGGSVGLKLDNYPGSYSLKWTKISTGNWGNETTITGGRTVTITAPGSGGWIAAIVKSEGGGGGSLIACFTIDRDQGTVPLEVNFDASCSEVPSGRSISSYQWNFGDGSSGTGRTVRHVYQNTGTCTATLTIIDNQNNRSSSTRTIRVNAVISNTFSSINYFGDTRNYAPKTASRWEVRSDAGNLRYFLNTSTYGSPGGNRLGEYAIIKNRNYSSDFIMTLKAKSDESLGSNKWADFAIVFAYQNESNYCYASFSSHSAMIGASGLYKIVSGNRYTVRSQGRGITDNNYHNIQIKRSGNTVSVSRDGVVIYSATDSRFGLAGNLGIGSYNDRVFFDDINVATSDVLLGPSNLNAHSVSDTRIDLSWTDNSNNEQGFKLERKSGNGSFVQIATLGANITSYHNTGLARGVMYTYRLRAYNSQGNSAYSNEVSASIPLSGTIFSDGYFGDANNYSPRNSSRWQVMNDGGNLCYFLNTSSYGSPGGDRLGEYSIVKNRSYNGNFTITLKARTGEILRLNRWSDLAIVFAYVNDQNYCYASLSSHYPAEGTTGLFKIVSGVRSIVKCQGVGLTDTQYHNIEVRRSGNTIYLLRDGILIVSATDARFGVSGSVGIGSYNDSACFDDVNVSTSNVPVSPGELTARSVSSSRIDLTWKDNSNNESGFKIERKIGSGSYSQIAATGANITSFSNTGLSSSTTYYYRVRAYNAHGSSSYSNVVSAKPQSDGDGGSGGLVALWKFNETGGTTAFDNSGNNHHGSLENGTLFTSGKFNNAAEFDGQDDRISAGSFDITSGSGLSIVAWIRADDFGTSDARIISKAIGTTTNDHYWMLSTISSGGIKLRFRLRTNGITTTYIASSGNIFPGVWTHVAATWDGSAMRLYKDGILVGNTGKGGSINTNSNVKVAIGNQPDGAGSRPFDGRIDELAVYNKALTQSEIGNMTSSSPRNELLNHVSDTPVEKRTIPDHFMLEQNFPNPFNPETIIPYRLSETSKVQLDIFDIKGNSVYHFGNNNQSPGFHQIVWKGLDKIGQRVPSGIYFYRIVATGSTQVFQDTKKMVLMK
jgi:hypothetical protein